ncbi:[citrate (pro-3S)-lyase] ligase [Anoxynatronum buryatiense]|uniref:[Citrate [pro-3S]-lyase] ligase n=1 Tax=Anoxynatronum buryatiense TaxID=489973 RepID=A0AA45WZK0_9CLOT|nr:GNAT family N-acetyltransferase [Anoxynatronum buryatiense]SMP68473.1 [citrate (pro-3S)-lyase] ligase [Anoxynatronum buryatiense]
MNPYQYHETILLPDDTEALAPIISLVKSQGLHFETDVELTVALYEGTSLVGTGSLAGNVFKCLAVRCTHQGKGIAAAIVSRLISEAFDRGRTHLFVFTPSNNRAMFSELGFFEVVTVAPGVTLLENRRHGLAAYVDQLKQNQSLQPLKNCQNPDAVDLPPPASSGSKEVDAIAAIVMNANPFTLGHQYLVETAANDCDTLHLFVLSEERSSFPAEVRYQLVKEGTAHLNNVVVHRGGPYLISSATFPSYFIKDASAVNEIHCRLDLTLFGSRIAPPLGISKRFIGEEPYCLTTRHYNETMKSLLPEMGIEVVEIPRLTDTDTNGWISASRVRAALLENQIDLISQMVPASTLTFLLSDEGRHLVDTMQKKMQKNHRH